MSFISELDGSWFELFLEELFAIPVGMRWISKALECMSTLYCTCNVDWPIDEHIYFSIVKCIRWLCVNSSIWRCIFPPLSSVVNVTITCLCCLGDFRPLLTNCSVWEHKSRSEHLQYLDCSVLQFVSLSFHFATP